MSLLGETYELNGDEEHQETPKELVIEIPRPKQFTHAGHVSLLAEGLKHTPPVMVIIGKKP